ncbi:MAG: hypothetical protein PVI92_08090 [Chromatiales bacterium]
MSRLSQHAGPCRRRRSARLDGREVDLIALSHPSGASTWHRTEPGKRLPQTTLTMIGRHPAWLEARRG